MTLSTVFSARKVALPRVIMSLLLLGVSGFLMGCQPLIEVAQSPAPVASAVATVAPGERGVAIMGIDFDPPLEAGQLLASGGLTLLVAVENQGRLLEPSARVTARLFDPAAGARAPDLANETITLKALAPGEVRIARFTQVTELPALDHYKLIVEVGPVPGERERDDNVKTFEIIVRAAE